MIRVRNLRAAAAGFTLFELLIALAIGGVLISGAVYVYSQSRRTFATTDTVARLQENGRYVFSILEPDVQLAGYYGYTNSPSDFKFISGGDTSLGLTASKLQAGSAALPALDETAQACGNNFAVDLIATVQGTNGTYGFPSTCPALGGGDVGYADTLTIRRSATPPADGLGKEVPGRLQLFVNRLSPTNQYIISDGVLPDTLPLAENQVQVRDLLVHTYYISKDSTEPDAAGLPALRMKALTDGPAFADSGDVEIMRGVEDLQVQFGIDTGDFNGDGIIDAGLNEIEDDIPDYVNGTATRYINPSDLKPGIQVVAVRIWVMMRAEAPEVGFVNRKTYTYAGKELKVDDNFRRVLLQRTIQLRNARTL